MNPRPTAFTFTFCAPVIGGCYETRHMTMHRLLAYHWRQSVAIAEPNTGFRGGRAP